MKANIKDKEKSGIYCIRNLINNKVYIGKAKCIHRRIKNHITNLNNKKRDSENDHFINAWLKYGRENFDYFVLEYLELDEKLISEKEIYWIKQFNSLNSKCGYNKREDSKTGLIVSDETRKKLSNAYKLRKTRGYIGGNCSKFYRENPEAKEEMANKVSQSRTIYEIHQKTKEGKLIKIWNTMKSILDDNPTYKRHNIYAVCSGEKPSMYGFVWRKFLKLKYSPVQDESLDVS